MIPKSLDRLERKDIESLVENKVAERRTLEYKQKLPSNSEKDKKEFLADVSSFANALGGDILYGIAEERDEAGNPTGIPVAATGVPVPNVDQETLRLESIIRDGIQPRIAGTQIEAIAGFQDGAVVIIRVPRSFAAPHMVTFQSPSRFFSRTSKGKYPLDVAEIRSAFVASEAIAERLPRFRAERVGRILSGEAPASMQTGPALLLHLIPISAWNAGSSLDLRNSTSLALKLPLLHPSGMNYRFNFEGFLTHNGDLDGRRCDAYVQLFRNGIIEAADFRLMPGDQRILPSSALERDVIERTKDYLALYGDLGVEPPVVAYVTLLEVRGYSIAPGGRIRETPGIDRDSLFLPDVLLEERNVDVASVFRPAFDAMWQAAGWPGCLNYDESGKRLEKR